MGVVTESQVTKGRFLAAAGGREALVSGAYAAKHSLKVGSKLDLNGTSFTVVGLVSPPLGGQSADVYLPLKQLQTLAEPEGPRERRARPRRRQRVGRQGAEGDQAALPQAQVASSKEVADQISGSLVDAKNLSNNLGLVLSIVAAAAAFLLAALLALSSVGKRIRELGTLKALGWTQRMVVRQIAGESLAQGILGGVLGIGLGVARGARGRRVRPDADRELAVEQRHDLRRQRRRGPHARRARCRSTRRSASRSSCSGSGSRCSAASSPAPRARCAPRGSARPTR